MMVNNSTSINKRNNHLSLQTIKHDGQQFNQYQQKEQTIKHDGQQFNQYQKRNH